MKVRLAVLALLLAAPLRAQTGSASDVMTRAVRAYQDLEFDAAASLLRRVLAPPLATALDDSTRARALAYLGAAEHYRGRPDSAMAVFRRLAVMATDYRPDTLVFPPEITQLYESVRSSVTPVAIQLSPDTASQPAQPPVALDTLPHAVAPPVSEQVLTAAHPRVTATAAGLLAIVRTSSDAGAAAGFAGSVRFRRLELEVRYVEGTLQPSDRQSDARDLVEGAVALGFAATPWLSLQLGPRARRYDSPFGAERWVTWQLGARGDFAIAGPAVRGHALLWQGAGLAVNVPPGSGSTRGGEVGFTIDLGSRPFWFGLAYGIDRAQVRDVARRETVETLTLTAGLRRR